MTYSINRHYHGFSADFSCKHPGLFEIVLKLDNSNFNQTKSTVENILNQKGIIFRNGTIEDYIEPINSLTDQGSNRIYILRDAMLLLELSGDSKAQLRIRSDSPSLNRSIIKARNAVNKTTISTIINKNNVLLFINNNQSLIL